MQSHDQSVAKVHALDKPRELRENINILKYLARYRLFDFTPAEFVLLTVLLTHTKFAGRTTLTAPMRLFIDGAEGGSTGVLQSPMPFNKKSFIKALKGLEQKDLVSVRRNRKDSDSGTTAGAHTYEVNTEALLREMQEFLGDLDAELPYDTAGLHPVVPTTVERD